MTWFFVTFLVACIGAFICYKLKITGGVMIGALLGVAIFNVVTDLAYFPLPAKVFAQIISGAFIGMQVNRKNLADLKQMIKPSAFLIGGLLIINIALGFIIYFLSPCDLMTSLFAAVPGGVADISIISSDMGADTSAVAVFQLFRMVSVLTFFPSILFPVARLLSKRKTSSNNEGTTTEIENSPVNPVKRPVPEHPFQKSVITLSTALLSGVLGALSGIPAGALLFSVLSVSALSIWTDKAYLPFGVKRFAMIIAGAFVGTSFVRESLTRIVDLVIPMILLVLGYFVFCILLGILLSRTCKLDIVTSLFACTPAGASDIALLATDLGAVGPQVALLQIVRLFCVITLFPRAIELVLLIWGALT